MAHRARKAKSLNGRQQHSCQKGAPAPFIACTENRVEYASLLILYIRNLMNLLSRTFTRLSICFLLMLPGSAALAVNSVFVQSTLDYNAILITGVDIVFIYDQATLDAFPRTKSQWYSGKREFLDMAGDQVDLVSIFVPQGFDSEMASLPERRDAALAVFVYGQHDSSDKAPVDITEMDNVLVQIDQFGILVAPRK